MVTVCHQSPSGVYHSEGTLQVQPYPLTVEELHLLAISSLQSSCATVEHLHTDINRLDMTVVYLSCPLFGGYMSRYWMVWCRLSTVEQARTCCSLYEEKELHVANGWYLEKQSGHAWVMTHVEESPYLKR